VSVSSSTAAAVRACLIAVVVAANRAGAPMGEAPRRSHAVIAPSTAAVLPVLAILLHARTPFWASALYLAATGRSPCRRGAAAPHRTPA